MHADEIAEHESWSLLREAVVGRLALVVDDAPDVFPLNYVVDHGTLVFRTSEGTKMSAALGQRVAFEIDGYDSGSGDAWSVVVKGHAREVKELHDALDVLALPLYPWHVAPKPRFVRIEPTSVTGRRFHVSGDGPGATGIDGAAPASDHP